MKSSLPFGTFLTIAAFIALVVGNDLIAWYLRFF
jgi:prepilin signal peptidase PulO-like enzyme (type II secretory pathway)